LFKSQSRHQSVKRYLNLHCHIDSTLTNSFSGVQKAPMDEALLVRIGELESRNHILETMLQQVCAHRVLTWANI
jgi:hypothetical protein